jgi:hypothetical protein
MSCPKLDLNLKNAKILFLCHGRIHEYSNEPVKLSTNLIDSATYIDTNVYSFADVNTPIHELSRELYADQFDVIIAVYCSLNAYFNILTNKVSDAFFNNVAAWLKKGGVFVTTGLPHAVVDAKLRHQVHETDTILELLRLKFGKSKKDIHHFDQIVQFAKDHPLKHMTKVLKKVSQVKTAKQNKDIIEQLEAKLNILREKLHAHVDVNQTIVHQFAEQIKAVTNGKLVFSKTKSCINEYLVFRLREL